VLLAKIIRIGAGDPGKMRDSFGYIVADIDIKENEIRIRKAKRWLGRSYKKVVQYIADDYEKNKLDHLVIERNNTVRCSANIAICLFNSSKFSLSS